MPDRPTDTENLDISSNASMTIDNHGERLVPGESHDRAEAVRHKSSYRFFRAVIAADLDRTGTSAVRILDLGCGVGHGSSTLAEIHGSEVVGIDASPDAVEYARRNYAAPNVAYVAATAEDYLASAEPFDYVVSRHALEHIPNGIELARRFPWTARLMVNVPYREPPQDATGDETNPHHELNDITEADFAGYPGAEFFYEDLRGVTTTTADAANSIICVSSAPGVAPVASSVPLPFPAWQPNALEAIALDWLDERADVHNVIAGHLARIDQLTAAAEAQQRAHDARIGELTAAYEEGSAARDRQIAELREAYESLSRDHEALRDSKAVKAALRLRRWRWMLRRSRA